MALLGMVKARMARTPSKCGRGPRVEAQGEERGPSTEGLLGDE